MTEPMQFSGWPQRPPARRPAPPTGFHMEDADTSVIESAMAKARAEQQIREAERVMDELDRDQREALFGNYVMVGYAEALE